MAEAAQSADTVRLVRTVHVRDRLGDLASTEPFKLGIDATIVDVEWDREVALVTWLVRHAAQGGIHGAQSDGLEGGSDGA